MAFFAFAEVTHVIAGATQTVRELLPIAPAQLLWINPVAAVALAPLLALAQHQPPSPRPGRAAAQRLGCHAHRHGGAPDDRGGVPALSLRVPGRRARSPLAKVRTMAVTTVVMFQVFYLLNWRSLRDSILKIGAFSNTTVFVGIASILALQTLFVYAPFIHAMFASMPLAGGDVLLSILVGALILPVIGLEKWWRNSG